MASPSAGDGTGRAELQTPWPTASADVEKGSNDPVPATEETHGAQDTQAQPATDGHQESAQPAHNTENDQSTAAASDTRPKTAALTHRGIVDEERERRKMFVGAISPTTDEGMLRQHFQQFGDIEEVLVIRDPQTYRPRGFAFVTFTDAQSIDKVMAAQEHLVDGRLVHPERTRVPGQDRDAPAPGGVSKLYIGNLSPEVDKDRLAKYFIKFGKIVDSLIVMDRYEPQKSRGFGFVTFEDDSAVRKVLEAGVLSMDNRVLEIRRATPRRADQEARRRPGGYGSGGAGDYGYGAAGYYGAGGYGAGYGSYDASGRGAAGYYDDGRGGAAYGRSSGDAYGGGRDYYGRPAEAAAYDPYKSGDYYGSRGYGYGGEYAAAPASSGRTDAYAYPPAAAPAASGARSSAYSYADPYGQGSYGGGAAPSAPPSSSAPAADPYRAPAASYGGYGGGGYGEGYPPASYGAAPPAGAPAAAYSYGSGYGAPASGAAPPAGESGGSTAYGSSAAPESSTSGSYAGPTTSYDESRRSRSYHPYQR